MAQSRIHLTVHGRGPTPTRYGFDGDAVVIGRQAGCDLVVADLELSREHARLIRTPAGWLLADLGSRNGTKLNGRVVDDPAPIDDGDEISLGATTVVVTLPPAQRPRMDELPTAIPAQRAPAPVLVGASEGIARVRAAIDRMAASGKTVLVTGETGTGKELVAQLLHQRSERASGPFVVVNCPALAPSLQEAELFGVERGVATGVEARTGRFEAAQHGTLFLDEIGDMEPAAQAKILRALQARAIERVGGRTPIPLDVRVIAATHHDLDADVEKGAFRGDLLHRLRVLSIHVPPLRERREDVIPLAEHFLAAEGGGHRLSDDAVQALLARDYPGNVRELEHLVARAVVAADGPIVSAQDLVPVRAGSTPARSGAPALLGRIAAGESFWDVVHGPFLRRELSRDDARALIRLAYDDAGGTYRGVARLFGIEAEYQKLFAFLKNHGLRVRDEATADRR